MFSAFKKFGQSVSQGVKDAEKQKTADLTAPQPPAQQAPAQAQAPQAQQTPQGPSKDVLAGAINRRFDLMSQRAQAQANASGQEETDAIKRRFAAMGGLNSGSAIKQLSLAEDRKAQRLASAKEGLDVARGEELGRLDEAQAAREFASAEAEKGRQFQKGERLGAQEFQKGLYDADAAFKERMFAFDKSKWGQTFDLELKKFGLEELVTKKNMELQEMLLNQKTIFDRIGDFGTNIFSGLSGDRGAKGFVGSAGRYAGLIAGGPIGAVGADIGGRAFGV